MTAPASVLIVGASAAGVATAEALRRQGYGGALPLLDTDSHPPYDRPPLSNQVLTGAWEPERAQLRTLQQLHALNADLRRLRRRRRGLLPPPGARQAPTR